MTVVQEGSEEGPRAEGAAEPGRLDTRTRVEELAGFPWQVLAGPAPAATDTRHARGKLTARDERIAAPVRRGAIRHRHGRLSPAQVHPT